MTASPKKIQASAFKKILEENSELEIIDVREGVEFRGESIAGSKNIPLSSLKKNAGSLDPAKAVYLLCQRGSRACQAAVELEKGGHAQTFIIEGGLEACKQAGVPVESGDSKIWALERQVRFTAGSLVLAGIFFSWLLHPAFMALSIFVGAGLVFSGVTNTCGMALLLARMPWNQNAPGCAVKKN